MLARKIFDASRYLEGWSDPVAFGVGRGGEIVLVARKSSEPPRDERGFWKTRFATPTSYLIISALDGRARTTVIDQESLAIDLVQPTTDGFLIAGSRCRWTAERVEQNGLFVDRAGKEISRITLGDGIADLRVDAHDEVWASYLDEGIFGNFGWSNPGPTAIGASGLVRFDRAGTQLFTFDPDGARTEWPADVYAMNLADDGAIWLYFYTTFPIVRIDRNGYRAYRCGRAGARALAVSGDRVLLFGGYEAREAACIVTLLANGETALERSDAVVDEAGVPLTTGIARGKGEHVYVLRQREVLQFSLDDTLDPPS